ncbi:MAG: LEA type 2 family protein, partial [Chitinophagales bacterium]|nr:LEA type 2 family protein [Chitinophagales bacterium]MDW8419413.1 hypothetical protein [Chitinophagales bacterium]
FCSMKFRYAGLLVAIAGFALLYTFNRSALEFVAQESFALNPVGNSGWECSSILKLHNPNLLSATLVSIEEAYRINGTEIAILNHEMNQTLPGQKTSRFPVSVRFARGDIPFDSIALLSVTGKVHYRSMFREGNLTIQIDTAIKL